MDDPMLPPGGNPRWRDRLGMYLLGIAIGCLILGWLFSMRQQAASRQGPPPAASPGAPSP